MLHMLKILYVMLIYSVLAISCEKRIPTDQELQEAVVRHVIRNINRKKFINDLMILMDENFIGNKRIALDSPISIAALSPIVKGNTGKLDEKAAVLLMKPTIMDEINRKAIQLGGRYRFEDL